MQLSLSGIRPKKEDEKLYKSVDGWSENARQKFMCLARSDLSIVCEFRDQRSQYVFIVLF